MSTSVTVTGVTTRVCVRMGVYVYLITYEECVLVGSVLVAAGVSLCEPREGMCIDPTAPVPCCIESSLNVSTGRDLGLRGVREVGFPCVRRNLTAHICVACAHAYTHARARTHTHTGKRFCLFGLGLCGEEFVR